MYPNTNNYYQPQSAYTRPIVPQQLGLKGRPVSSIEEVRASGIDFDGSIFYFPDLANKRIYTKQINYDGTALLNMYELKEIPVNPMVENNVSYVTKEELDAALEALRNQLLVSQSEAPQSTETAIPQPTNYNF